MIWILVSQNAGSFYFEVSRWRSILSNVNNLFKFKDELVILLSARKNNLLSDCASFKTIHNNFP